MDRVFQGLTKTKRATRAANLLLVNGTEEKGYSSYQDCRKLSKESSPQDTLSALAAAINNSAINLCDQFAVHSGVVSWDGGVAVLPAPSGGGKSTLTASLIKSGFAYMSDEALVLREDGTTISYAKPLALSEWSSNILGIPSDAAETLLTAEDLGGEVDLGGRHVSDIILSEISSDPARMDPLPGSDGLIALIQYSFNHYKNPREAWRISSRVASNARVWRLEYQDPLDAAELISSTLR